MLNPNNERPAYALYAKNPITRAGIIRALIIDKGYSLYEGLTISDYFNRWPAKDWPVVLACANHPHYPINLSQGLRFPNAAGAKWVADISEIPHAGLIFPKAAKYSISYRKAEDNSIGYYIISNPIEESQCSITAYAFKHGIRTFIKSRIRSFKQVV